MKVESALTLPSPGQTLVLGSETLQFGGGEVWGDGDQDQSPEAQGHEEGLSQRIGDRKGPGPEP